MKHYNKYTIIRAYPSSPPVKTVIQASLKCHSWVYSCNGINSYVLCKLEELEPSLYPEIFELIKEKLFTTEDGVDIYKGDDYWVFDYGALLNTSNSIFKQTASSIPECPYRFRFSTLEKAVSYAKNYKRFSINELEFALRQIFPEYLQLDRYKENFRKILNLNIYEE